MSRDSVGNPVVTPPSITFTSRRIVHVSRRLRPREYPISTGDLIVQPSRCLHALIQTRSWMEIRFWTSPSSCFEGSSLSLNIKDTQRGWSGRPQAQGAEADDKTRPLLELYNSSSAERPGIDIQEFSAYGQNRHAPLLYPVCAFCRPNPRGRPLPRNCPTAHRFSSAVPAACAATSAIKAAPTPLPSFAIPIRILFSPLSPSSGISLNASRIYSSNPG